jgi:ribosomal protein S5
LEEIERAQKQVRQGKSNQIIDSIEKSRQRAKNQLKQIRRLEDLQDLD